MTGHTVPTWGYNAKGESRIFDLKEGDELPSGWEPAPFKGHHPHDVEQGIAPDPVEPEPKKRGKGAETE
jgi:hypothetical protein